MNTNPDDKSKDKNSSVPLYITHPLPLGEKTSDAAEELAVRLAKKWVDENRI